jgi:broad specificity phosphatase PhoE
MSDHDQHQSFEVGGGSDMPVGPGHRSTFDGRTIDFGHYAGRDIAELADEDPDYLRWLARHPSGVRYRAEIARVLASAVPHPGDWQR